MTGTEILTIIVIVVMVLAFVVALTFGNSNRDGLP